MQQLLEHGLAVEEAKILPDLVEIECGLVRAQQRPDVLQVLCPSWVIDEPLKLEPDQPFRTYDPQRAEARLKGCRTLEQSPGGGTAGV